MSIAPGEAVLALDLGRPAMSPAPTADTTPADHAATAGGLAGPAGHIAALVEAAAIQAAGSRPGGLRETTVIDLHLGCLRRVSGPVLARACITGGGRTLCFCEVSVTDAAGRLCAQAMVTLRLGAAARDAAREDARDAC